MAFQRMLRRSKSQKVKPARNFTRVKSLEFDKEGAVEEFLDRQFTVNYDDGTFGFLFYDGKGDTWTPLDEGARATMSMSNAEFKTMLWAQAAPKPIAQQIDDAAMDEALDTLAAGEPL